MTNSSLIQKLIFSAVLIALAGQSASIFAYGEKQGDKKDIVAAAPLSNASRQFLIAKAMTGRRENSGKEHKSSSKNSSHQSHKNSNKHNSHHSNNKHASRKNNQSHHSNKNSGKNHASKKNNSHKSGKAFPSFPGFKNKDHSDKKGHSNSHSKSDLERQRQWKAKYEALEAAKCKAEDALKTTLAALAASKALNAQLQDQNCALNNKVLELEKKLTYIMSLENKIQDLEKLVYNLKCKLAEAQEEASNWKSKYNALYEKTCQYEETIRKLSAYLTELRAKIAENDECHNKLAEAFAKIAELKKCLEEANEKLKMWAERREKHKKNGHWNNNSQKNNQNHNSQKNNQSHHSQKNNNSHHSKDDKWDNKGYQTIKVTPIIHNGYSKKAGTTILVGAGAR